MKKLKINKTLLIAFILFAVGICIYILFNHPMPGVADQGDFDRVMSASGLELTDKVKNLPFSDRFYNYITTEYKIYDFNSFKHIADSFNVNFLGKTFSVILTAVLYIIVSLFRTTMSMFILPINFICKIFGQDIFRTNYLAVLYCIIYIFAMYLVLKYLNFKKNFQFIILALVALFIFLDGYYLIWFNSLYGEPMIVVTLMLFIGTYLYYIYNRYLLETDEKPLKKIVPIFISALLFLGSKMQVFTAMPVIFFILSKIIYDNKNIISKKAKVLLIAFLIFICAYPLIMNKLNGDIGKDTQYNSVFFGVLKDSKDPRQDLIDMGLNPDMAVEAGKHSYLDKKDYVKYLPRTEITEKEFYSKMSNGKLVKFYLTHPLRFIQGMEYTANQAFTTRTSMGMYEKSYSEEPIRNFNRFTLWDKLRDMLPKNLIFIILSYVIIVTVSIIEYVKNKNKYTREKIHLLWCLIFIATIQSPMPLVGNGHADTSKQLYLFNYVFDMMIFTSIYYISSKIINIFKSKN